MLIITKLLVTVTVVVSLSLIAEYVSPRAAGILSGYPLGTAISLFFFGFEIGPEFASESAVYTMIGLIATQAFVFFYYKTSLYFKDSNIFASSIISFIGYFIVVSLLYCIKPTQLFAILIPIISIFVFIRLFKEIENTRIGQTIQLNAKVIAVRAAIAASAVLIITGAAKSLGTTWAGLFSAFPITLFPLILIVHFTYNIEHVHTIIKNFPLGLGSIIAYAIVVSITYPMCGIYVGTFLSFMAATGYLFIYRCVTTYAKH